MDLTNKNEAITSLIDRSISQRSQAKETLDTSNEDYSDGFWMDEDIPVFPDKLLKLKSQKRKRKEDDVICKTRNHKVLKHSQEVPQSAPSLFPTFVKIMVHHHVAGSFWLNIPNDFAKLHLPNKNVTLTLEDHDGKEYDVKYLWAQAALSAGWRGFSIAQKLSKGDKLVFQLVKALKFKVHIARLNDLNEANGSLNLVSSDSSSKEVNSAKDPKFSKRKVDKHRKDLEVGIFEVHSQKDEFKNSASSADHNEDNLDSLMMEDEDIMVLPHKLRKLKSQERDTKADHEICKTSNVEVLKQTIEVQPSAPAFFPAFVKNMVHSNVASGFWLHLPNKFCDLHLPKKDVIITLEDDDGIEHDVKYLWANAALSSGWRGFSIAHKLSKGDKLVFQLVKPLKFKVHIIRLDDLNEADGVSNLVMSNSSKVKLAKDLNIAKRKGDKHCDDLEVDIIEDHFQEDELKNSASTINHIEKIKDNTNSLLPDVSNGVHLRKSTSTNFEDEHIMSLDDSNEADGALNLGLLDLSLKEVKSARDLRVSKRNASKHCEDLEVEIIEDHSQKDELRNPTSNTDHLRKKDDTSSFPLLDVSDGVHLPKYTSANFEDVRSIEDFVIAVHDVVIDSAVPEHVRNKYYELCCSQKSYLHVHLLRSLDPLLLSAGITSETVMMLSAGVISAVVNIADAIRASTITTLPENFAIWEQSLKQFEKLGMNVGFLLDRLIQLMGLARRLKRCWEIKSECIKAEENMQIMESRILKIREEISKLNTEAMILNPNGDDLELSFKEVANSAW